MALQSIAYLQSKFETGDVPTQQDFWDLLDSFLHLAELVQVTGASTSQVMSQKAVTDAINALVQHYKGEYLSSGALAAAHPTAIAGDYAYVDAGVGQSALSYIWDVNDAQWRQSGITAVAWGTLIGSITSQTDLVNYVNLRANAAFTITAKVASYTMAAAEKTIMDAGGSLIMESTTGDLTIPPNATTAFGIGHSFGVRGFANIIATGPAVATGTNGTLAIPTGRTVIVEKTATDTWLVHNGAPLVTIWTTSEPGISTESSQAQAEAIPTGAQAGSTGGLAQSRAPSEIGLYYLIRKIMTLAWTWTVGPIISDATASTPAWFNGSKKLVTAVVADLLDWLGQNPISVAVSLSVTTVTLDFNTKYSRKFHTVTAHAANFTLTKTNKTVMEYGHYNFLATGTIVIQLDTDDRMGDDVVGWNLASKQLTLVTAGTGLGYSLVYSKLSNGNFYVTVSSKITQ